MLASTACTTGTVLNAVETPLEIVVGAGWVWKISLVATTSEVTLLEVALDKLAEFAVVRANVSWSAEAV